MNNKVTLEEIRAMEIGLNRTLAQLKTIKSVVETREDSKRIVKNIGVNARSYELLKQIHETSHRSYADIIERALTIYCKGRK